MTVCKRNGCSTLSCRSTDATQQSSESERQSEIKSQEGKERERRGRIGVRRSPLPLPLLTCKQASATRGAERGRGGGRESRLTRFRGLWSIKGLRRNSKTTPTISTSEVRTQVPVGYKCEVMCNGCVSLFFFFVLFPMCKVVWRVLCLTCGGIGAGTSESCVQPGSVSSLGGCCRQKKQNKTQE